MPGHENFARACLLGIEALLGPAERLRRLAGHGGETGGCELAKEREGRAAEQQIVEVDDGFVAGNCGQRLIIGGIGLRRAAADRHVLR